MQGPLPGAVLPPDKQGWCRRDVWEYDDAASLAGDYAVGPGFEARYERMMPVTVCHATPYNGAGGRVDEGGVFEVIEELYYAEQEPGAPEGELVLRNRTFIAKAASRVDASNGNYESEDYEYTDAHMRAFNADDMDTVTATLRELALRDERSSIC